MADATSKPAVSLSPVLTRRMWILPLALLLVFVGLSIGVWRLQRDNEISQAQAEATASRSDFAGRLRIALLDGFTPLQKRWEAGWLGPRSSFDAEANELIAGDPELGFIGWVDDHGICQELGGPSGGGVLEGQDLSRIAMWADLLQRADTNGDGAVSQVQFEGRFGPVLYAALPGVDGGWNGPVQGAIVFQFRLKPMFDELSDPKLGDRLVLELLDQNTSFFRIPEQRPAGMKLDDSTGWEPVVFLDQTWHLRGAASAQLINSHLAILPAWVPWLWIAGVLLFVGSAYQLVLYRKSSDQRIDHYLKALEMVAETSAAILGKIGSSEEVWQRLPAAARILTGARIAAVGVLEDDDRAIRIVATDAVEPNLVGEKFDLKDVYTVAECVQSRRIVNIPDSQTMKAPVNRALVDRFHIRSILNVPLIVHDRIIGVMLLSSDRPGCFDATAQRLGELWGLLAAVTVANERMYEQMKSAIDARDLHLAQRDRLLAQRDALFDIDFTLAKQKSGEEILQRIVELAPSPLGVDLCQVVLVDEKSHEMVVAATTPPYHVHVNGFRYRMESTNSAEAIKQRKVIIVENGPEDPRSQSFLKSVLPCGSIMHVPLVMTSGEPIGVLVLLRAQRGGFSTEQRNLAQLFASRAAVAIENAQLYQQTLRDGQARAMLLRELTHRVKNSLAGIVTLLTLDPPAMSPQARQWLERVVERIRTLARTHEMFTSGKPGGSLREIIDQTLRALSVVTPTGVAANTEIPRKDIVLRADRAVSVAMLLHELCYNALVHGLDNGGGRSLLVRVSILPGQKLQIEVIDDGRGFEDDQTERLARWSGAVETPAAASAVLGRVRSGLGLSLVRDFVSRELHGQFEIKSVPSHGTTAQVIFELLENEASPEV